MGLGFNLKIKRPLPEDLGDLERAHMLKANLKKNLKKIRRTKALKIYTQRTIWNHSLCFSPPPQFVWMLTLSLFKLWPKKGHIDPTLPDYFSSAPFRPFIQCYARWTNSSSGSAKVRAAWTGLGTHRGSAQKYSFVTTIRSNRRNALSPWSPSVGPTCQHALFISNI